jgi:signal transduction histidine kinase
MNERIRLDVQTHRYTDMSSIKMPSLPLASLMTGESTAVHFNEGSSKRMLFKEDDIHGNPALVIDFAIQRDIYQQGLRQLMTLIASIIMSALVFGALIWWLLRKHVINRLSAMNEEVNVVRDSLDTSRREKERELIRLEKLESLGQMAGGIAHDFNNTLTAILANLDILQSSETSPREEKNEIIHDAIDATLRAKELATQLLTYS